MNFLIITHAVHKKKKNFLYAYEPYVREMNLWSKHVNEVKIIAPFSADNLLKIDERFIHNNYSYIKISSFNISSFKNKIKTFFLVPTILLKIFKAMIWADHIHLRCPGNVGLLGCFVQILFPNKPKTVKYAGNWDPKSKQPLSYKLQKMILSNTFLTKNCSVLVYGKWENQSKNIMPFFTASYKQDEIVDIPSKNLGGKIKFIFVGAFTKGKQPLLSVKVIEKLSKKYDIQLDMFGNGQEYSIIKNYIYNNGLNPIVNLHGNQPKKIVKKAFQNSHFLIFISKSEGWPKVVAEAMFWSCLPISSNVSCVKYMLGDNTRGSIIEANSNIKAITKTIEEYIENEELYRAKVIKAKLWSQKFTLDKFEDEIKKILV